ncbi:uncharacterized protein [Amphiura filiformis]|uniref:uncharacterized protein n=1 Tax=Amphiura filiformis TaxID=82378 RepID=UPI003B214618
METFLTLTVSLFTNTPIDKTLEIIRDRLTKDTTLPERIRLNVTDTMELLEFILTTTYFSFRGNIYRQKFGAAMVSPVSAILANLSMEWLEQQAIATAPLDCAPKYWRRYVDDVLEVIKKDTTEKLTEHLNKVDETGNIKFTYEEEEVSSIPFLDTLVVRKQDGSIKLLIYRKKTHTDQYLNFESQHPLHQKLGVIRTLIDRMDSIVTEEEDKKEEEKKIRTALQNCGYPRWAMDRVKQQMSTSKIKCNSSKKSTDDNPSKGMVVLPYVAGLSEKLKRIFWKHKIATAMKPHNTIKSLLVHPKDKRETNQMCEVVYNIDCKGCEKSYIGETGRAFDTRLKEHQKDEKKAETKKYTRARRKESTTEFNKSAITDHVAAKNHVIDWEELQYLTEKQTSSKEKSGRPYGSGERGPPP